jgi:hypothetical protein
MRSLFTHPLSRQGKSAPARNNHRFELEKKKKEKTDQPSHLILELENNLTNSQIRPYDIFTSRGSPP